MEKEVLQALKHLGRAPVYRIAGYLGVRVQKVAEALKLLVESGEVKQEIETRSVYYSVKK